jgi:cell fate (sporulation/competence/biofilm development) regulator YlbF (YheA/YmcA/DUF963 family)
MRIDELTRQLGFAIQENEAYRVYREKKRLVEQDADLQKQSGELELLRQSYMHETQKENADPVRVAQIQKDFSALRQEMQKNPRMQDHQEATREIETLLSDIMSILKGCANGEDPATYRPPAACGGQCGGCAGCR